MRLRTKQVKEDTRTILMRRTLNGAGKHLQVMSKFSAQGCGAQDKVRVGPNQTYCMQDQIQRQCRRPLQGIA